MELQLWELVSSTVCWALRRRASLLMRVATASELKAFPAPDEQSEPEHLRAVTIEADQSIGEEVNHIVLFSK